MHVTLVKPTLGRTAHDERFVDEARMEPLQLGVLAGLTPDGVDLTLFDDRVDDFDPDAPTDLVAITVETFTARRAYEIAAAYRERRVPVVMGGMHATLLPDEVAGARRRARDRRRRAGVAAGAPADARDGRLAPRYHGAPRHAAAGRAPASRPLPRQGLPAGRALSSSAAAAPTAARSAPSAPSSTIATTRGPSRRSSPRSRRAAGATSSSSTTTSSPTRTPPRSCCGRSMPLGVRWVSQASVDHAHDPELLRLFAESGCLGNVIGFESLDPGNLREARKGPNLRASPGYADEVAALRAHHLQTWAAFVLGYDHDTVASLEATCEWAIEQRFAFAAFNVLMPYPGTALYARLAAEGRLLYDGRWWLHPDYRFNHAAFRPARMTADELTEVGWRCRRRWSSLGSIVRRALDPATHLRSLERFAVYCAYNPLFRRESFKKQGMRLGTR